MAKNATSTKDDNGNKPENADKAGLSWDNQRTEDEKKDRERLRQEHADRTPEKLSAVKTELANLKLQFEADVTKLRDAYAKKKQELSEQMGGYSDAPIVPQGPQPSNETLADGSPRRTLNIEVTA